MSASLSSSTASLTAWPPRRWLAAAAVSATAMLAIAIPTDLIDTPLFSREVPPTSWSWPALAVSSVLMGLLTATYVRPPDQGATTGDAALDRRLGAGGFLTFLAVGCPVCNKLALLALGASGAMTWFAPAQPWLSAIAVGLLVWGLHRRLTGEVVCPVPTPAGAQP